MDIFKPTILEAPVPYIIGGPACIRRIIDPGIATSLVMDIGMFGDSSERGSTEWKCTVVFTRLRGSA